MDAEGVIAPSGDLFLQVIRGGLRDHQPVIPGKALTTREVAHFGLPRRGLDDDVNEWKTRNLPNLWRGFWRIKAAERLGVATVYGSLGLKVFKGDGRIIDLGLVSMRVVTTVGAGYIVDAFQNLVEMENQKYHGIGTGTTAEAVGDTALVTELTTEYNPNSTRATGTTTESSATVFQTVATNTLDSGTPAVTEHGIFSASSAGVLLDRTKFAAINLDGTAGDGLQSTYNFTIAAGS